MLDNENPVKEQAAEEIEDQVKNIDTLNGQKAEKPNVINADSQIDSAKFGQDLPAVDHRKDGVEPKDTLQEVRGNVPDNQDQILASKQKAGIRTNVEYHKGAQFVLQSRDNFKEDLQKNEAANLLSKGRDGERLVPHLDPEVPKAVAHVEGAKPIQEHGVRNPNVPLNNIVKIEKEGPEPGERHPNVPDNETKVPKISENLGIKAKSKEEVHQIELEGETKPLKAEEAEKHRNENMNGRDGDTFQEKPNQPGHIENRKEKIQWPVNADKGHKDRRENLINRAQSLDEKKIEEEQKALKGNINLQRADPNAPSNHNEKNPSQKDGEPYKDLKLDGGGDLRRKKRDLRSSMDESYQSDT
eukprot:g43132.t1